MATNDPARAWFRQVLQEILGTHFQQASDPVLNPANHAAYLEQLNKSRKAQAESIATQNLSTCPIESTEAEALSPIVKTLPPLQLFALTPRQATEHDRQKSLYLRQKTRMLRVELQKYDEDLVGRREAMVKFGEEVFCAIFGSDWASVISQQHGGKTTPSLIYQEHVHGAGSANGSNAGGTCCCPKPNSMFEHLSSKLGKPETSLSKHVAAALDKAESRRNLRQNNAVGESDRISGDEETDSDEDWDMDDEDATFHESLYEALLKDPNHMDSHYPGDLTGLYDDYDDVYGDDYGYDFYNSGLDYHDDYDDGYGLAFNEAMFEALYAKSHGDDSLFHPSYAGFFHPNNASKGKAKKKKGKKGNMGSATSSQSQSKSAGKETRSEIAKLSTASATIKPGAASTSKTPLAAKAKAGSTRNADAEKQTLNMPTKHPALVTEPLKHLGKASPLGIHSKLLATSVASVGLGLASSPGSLRNWTTPVTANKAESKDHRDKDDKNVLLQNLNKKYEAYLGETPTRGALKDSAAGIDKASNGTGSSTATQKQNSGEEDAKGKGRGQPPVVNHKLEHPSLGKRKKIDTSSSSDSTIIKVNLPTSSSSTPLKPAKKKLNPIGKPAIHPSSSTKPITNNPTLIKTHSTAKTGEVKPKAKGNLPNSQPKPKLNSAAAATVEPKKKGIKYEMIVFKKPYQPSKRPERDCWHGRVYV
ncbi:uncharacterized protein UTRI_02818 [Ustilago trichophora]|uniref:Uncharacterized protein n=1 Tax=Ustilago trichophora TaxID=86804 RepID=A0A5C3ES90_9BASI|nr:uncharacterized protein UTRI_02818 [Ustilago trichophora]